MVRIEDLQHHSSMELGPGALICQYQNVHVTEMLPASSSAGGYGETWRTRPRDKQNLLSAWPRTTTSSFLLLRSFSQSFLLAILPLDTPRKAATGVSLSRHSFDSIVYLACDCPIPNASPQKQRQPIDIFNPYRSHACRPPPRIVSQHAQHC